LSMMFSENRYTFLRIMRWCGEGAPGRTRL